MRYRLYGEWEKDDERNPVILAARQTAKVPYAYPNLLLQAWCFKIIILYSLLFTGVCCMFLFVIMQLDTRRILKRLAKENLKQLGRMVAKLAHANPMTVLRTIVHQVLFFLKKMLHLLSLICIS